MGETRDLIRQWINVLAVVATLAVNALANALPLNGLNTGQISDRFQVYFVPAGYVFSIWGLIYLGIIAFGIYQLLPSQAANPRLRGVGYLFALSCLANVAWLFLWHYLLLTLTVVAMLALLLLLIAIYLRLGIGRGRFSAAETWLVNVPFSVYLGWITVATIANVTDLLSYLSWSGWGLAPEVWAIIVLTVATAIVAAVSLTRRDIGYALVIVWAYVGIAVKQSATPVVATTALVLAAVVGIVAAASALGALRSRMGSQRPA
jgi:benzodiazapine receptor